jgi:hypothetical protein
VCAELASILAVIYMSMFTHTHTDTNTQHACVYVHIKVGFCSGPFIASVCQKAVHVYVCVCVCVCVCERA